MADQKNIVGEFNGYWRISGVGVVFGLWIHHILGNFKLLHNCVGE